MKNELWKDVKGYPNYSISNHGRVKNINRNTFLKICFYRYPRVCLYINNNHKKFSVHRLVAKAFCKKLAYHNQVNHKDGNILNNHFSNLEWCTGSENAAHSYNVLKNKAAKGSNHGNSKLKELDILNIRKISKILKFNNKQISIIFEVNSTTVWNIINRKKWKHI